MNMTFKVNGALFTAERSEVSDREYEILVRFNNRCIGAAACSENTKAIRHLCAGQLGSGLLATMQAPSDATDFELAVLVASNWLARKSFLEGAK